MSLKFHQLLYAKLSSGITGCISTFWSHVMLLLIGVTLWYSQAIFI